MRRLLFVLLILGAVQVYGQNRKIDLNEGGLQDANLTLRSNVGKFQDISSRSREFIINEKLQNENSVTLQDTILLSLFSDATYKTYIDEIEKDINGVVSIRARFVDYPMGYSIITTSPENNSLVVVEIPELNEKYISRVDPLTKNNYLIEIDKKKAIVLEGGESLIPPSTESVREEFEADGLTRSTAPANIDIMIVYTPAAKAWSASNEGGINNTIASIMAKSKLVLDNSNVQIGLTLVHSAEVNYTESESSNTDLRRLTNVSDGYLEEVHQWRDQYCADLVVFLTKVEDTGGLGWLLNTERGSPNYGFSISRIQQASWTYTVIHEIGHNMGLHHHNQQTVQPGPGLYPYSSGWRWKGNDNRMYCSVMTYEGGSYFTDGLYASRVPYFANPSLNYAGYPTGHPTEADAARSLRETKHIIAGYRRGNGECNAPTGLSVSNLTTNSATLRWTAIAGAQSYTVEYKASTATSWRIAASASTTTSCNLSGLTSGVTYNWRVRTNCSSTSSSPYMESSFTAAVLAACVNNYEPNESVSTAYTISTNVTYNAGIGSSTDQDYYKFTISAKSNVVITLQNLPKDYDLQLLNSSGSYLTGSSNGGTSSETITQNGLAAGTYYVRVYGYSGNFDLSTCYALRVSATAAPSDEATGMESINSDISSAVNLYPNPVEDILYVKSIAPNSKESTVSIIDVSGRRIKDVMINNEEEVRVDVSELSSGLYYLNISGKGYKFIKK